MLAMRKSLIVLGSAGAMLLGNPIPGMAQGLHVQTPAIEFGVGVPWYGYRHDRGALAYVPRYRMERGWADEWPNPYKRPGMSWDSYGQRWDGVN
jgi:hypothetical protein